jgi:hypothetical protein
MGELWQLAAMRIGAWMRDPGAPVRAPRSRRGIAAGVLRLGSASKMIQ